MFRLIKRQYLPLVLGNHPIVSMHIWLVVRKVFPYNDVSCECDSCPYSQHAPPSGCSFNTINTLRPSRNEQHFTDDIFKRIFYNENVWISLKIPLTFVPKGPINNIPALVQIMAWRRSGDKPLTEPIMVSLPTHICVTRPQWFNQTFSYQFYAHNNSLNLHFDLTALMRQYSKPNIHLEGYG